MCWIKYSISRLCLFNLIFLIVMTFICIMYAVRFEMPRHMLHPAFFTLYRDPLECQCCIWGSDSRSDLYMVSSPVLRYRSKWVVETWNHGPLDCTKLSSVVDPWVLQCLPDSCLHCNGMMVAAYCIETNLLMYNKPTFLMSLDVLHSSDFRVVRTSVSTSPR
jgi:hypothetical protein